MSTVRETASLSVQNLTGTMSLSTVYAVAAAVVVGVFIIGAVGFAGSEILHNAAHDVRHSLSFPCH